MGEKERKRDRERKRMRLRERAIRNQEGEKRGPRKHAHKKKERKKLAARRPTLRMRPFQSTYTWPNATTVPAASMASAKKLPHDTWTKGPGSTAGRSEPPLPP